MPNDPAEFDPEKVDKYDPQGMYDFYGMGIDREGEWIRSEDYDSLLAMYRNAQLANRALSERIEELAKMFGVCDGVIYLNDWISKAAKLMHTP